MAATPIQPQAEPEPGSAMVKLAFLVPAEWRDALAAAAAVQRISMADLCRIILRGFLRERYSLEEQRQLGVS